MELYLIYYINSCFYLNILVKIIELLNY